MSMKKNRGFTLIELLSVIIIIGILFMIGIPSVTMYIGNSRKNAFAVTAKQYINGARNKVNSFELTLKDKETTYYVPISCIELEKGGESPFGNWDKAYVGVVYANNIHKYFFVGKDSSNMGMYITAESNISSKVVIPIITPVDTSITIGGRANIKVLDDNCSSDSFLALAPTDSVAEDVINGDSYEEVPTIPTPPVDPPVPQGELLSGRVAVGDYVIYDAGTWSSTIPQPTTSDILAFGGVTAGTSRNASVKCHEGTGPHNDNQNNGWRVLKVENGRVYLVHAGQSECFRIYEWRTHGILNGLTYNALSVLGKGLHASHNPAYTTTSRNFNYYLNEHAQSVSIYTKADRDGYVAVKGTDALTNTKLFHWLATDANGYNLNAVDYSGIVLTSSEGLKGIRPVVALWSCTNTLGKATDAYGHEAWTLSVCNPD